MSRFPFGPAQLGRMSFVALLLGGFFLSPGVRADVLTGNLPNDPSTAGLGTIITGAEGRSKAVGFTTPTGLSYFLTDATFVMQFTGDSAEPGAVPQVALWSDSAGNPGSQLAVFDNPATLGAKDFYNFTLSTPLLLSANTTYWILVNGAPSNTNPAADAFYWNAVSPSINHSGVGSFVGYRFSASSTPPTGSSTVFNNVQVNGFQAVPEPSAALLLGFVGVGLFAKRRRH